MFIEISIGEALDRLSILELKMEKINDKKKHFLSIYYAYTYRFYS
jgi:hypothetical protein